MKKVELLSPVGNMEMLYQAVHNGADAVYLAGVHYGARKFAKNFTEDELVEATRYAHLYDVRVYVTVNTLIYEMEMEEVLSYIEFLYCNGVDAVIMQDVGLIGIVRKMFPELEIHASTQCHNHSKAIVQLWKELGLKRVVLARELSLSEITNIDVEIEKEVFVYGALCVSYSGCCLFSSLNGGRSGNRGECVGSCRLPYQLVKNEEVLPLRDCYLLSTKELNTLNHVPELIEAGIDSFKIEGRMKSPFYVGYVTRLFRNLIDEYAKGGHRVLTKEEENNLKKLFNREFTNGYLFENPDIMNIKSPNHIGVVIGQVIRANLKQIVIKLERDSLHQEDGIRFQHKNVGMIVNRLYRENGLLTDKVEKGKICILDNKWGIQKGDVVLKTIDAELVQSLSNYPLKKIPVTMLVEARLGLPIRITICDGKNTIYEEGAIVERALQRETTEEEIRKQLSKLGNTPFVLKEIVMNRDKGGFIRLTTLNELRRRLVERLISIREGKTRNVNASIAKSTLLSLKQEIRKDSKSCQESMDIASYQLHVLVRTEEQLIGCIENHVDSIYVVDYYLYCKYQELDNVYYRLLRVSQSIQNHSARKLLVGDLGGVRQYGENCLVIGDYYLNVVNFYSLIFLKDLGARRVTLSIELEINQIRALMKKVCQNEISHVVELFLYGTPELMIMKYCPLKKVEGKCVNCSEHKDQYYLRDQLGRQYPITHTSCLTHIMHHQVIDRIAEINNYRKMGIYHYRIELWQESRKDLEMILKRIKERLR